MVFSSALNSCVLNEKTVRSFFLYFCKGNKGLTPWPTNRTNLSVVSLGFHFCEIKNIMRSHQCLIYTTFHNSDWGLASKNGPKVFTSEIQYFQIFSNGELSEHVTYYNMEKVTRLFEVNNSYIVITHNNSSLK